MYNKAGLAGAAGLTALPFTGLNWVWYLTAGFALVAAGAALLRVLPKLTR
jgi:hypothetical protein